MSNSISKPNARLEKSGDGTVHRISFKLDFRYYQALRNAKRKCNPTDDFIWRWRYAFVFAISGVILIWMVTGNNFSSTKIWSWEFLLSLGGVGLLAPLGVFLIDFLFDRVLTRWLFQRSSMAGKTFNFELTDKNVSWSAEGMRGELDWNLVKQVVLLKDYLFFFFGKTEAIGLPRHAALSGDAFDNIVSFAKERVNG